MAYATVDEYISNQKSPQKEILIRLRKLILSSCPGIKEEMKMGVPWYEDKYYLVALRDKVNIGFSVKGLTAEEKKNFEGKGAYMRHLKIFSLADIDEKRIRRLLKLVKDKYVKCH